jgi:hypothetical protein
MSGPRRRGLRVRKVLRDPEAEGTSRAAPEGLCPQGAENAPRLEPEDRDPQSLCKASDRDRARLARHLAATSPIKMGVRKGRDRRSSGPRATITGLGPRRRFEPA